ncbi:DUF47 domain-containing protein [Holophaga foetida]|uniref:DUF47 domain-containing protein n=1 Tax=Holophaga foetida TaxID=35839 RepID=UPI0002473EA5|nr:DUF47 family protein [Holophaga foetida]
MSLNTLIRRVKPRETVFLDLLEASAANLLEATRYFDTTFREGQPGHWGPMRDRMKALEHKGDALTVQIMDRLNHTFALPLEREDIIILAHKLDDVVDGLYALCEILMLYKVDTVPEVTHEISPLMVKAAQEIPPLIEGLRTFSQTAEMRDRVLLMTEIENQADAIYNRALAELFSVPRDPVTVIKWKEILDHMEETCDRLELVAKVVSSTIMRNA